MFANTKKSFSLAEIILVLTIIGSIASFTIPAFVQNVQDRILQIAWKSAFSDLSQATNRIMLDNGGTLVGAFQKDNNSARDKYAQYLKYVKSCDDPATEGCWSESFLNELNGSLAGLFWVYYSNGSSASSDVVGGLVLSNGMFVAFNTFDPDPATCSDNVCGSITVDVNGYKGPNIMGRDIFHATIRKNGLVPTNSGTCIMPPNTGWSNFSNYGVKCSVDFLKQ